MVVVGSVMMVGVMLVTVLGDSSGDRDDGVRGGGDGSGGGSDCVRGW